MARRYKPTIETPAGSRTVFHVTVRLDRGGKPQGARFGGIPLLRQRAATLTDRRPVMGSTRRNELIHRLLAERCELCQEPADLQVHDIRKLADLDKPGRPDKPTWMHLMAMRRRKTLVVCRSCHQDIHTGRATTTTPTMITGERGARKPSTPRSGRDRRQRTPTTGTSPAIDFT